MSQAPSFPLCASQRLTQVQGGCQKSQAKSLTFQSQTQMNPPHLTTEQTLTHPSLLKNTQGHLIHRGGGKRKKGKVNKRAYFKFRPTVQFGLAAFPHAPDTVNPSATPSSLSSPLSAPPPPPPPSPQTPPLPPASKHRLTSCLPLTLSYPLPRPHLAGLQNRQANEAGCKHTEHLTERAREGGGKAWGGGRWGLGGVVCRC